MNDDDNGCWLSRSWVDQVTIAVTTEQGDPSLNPCEKIDPNNE